MQCPIDLRTSSVDAEKLVNTVKLMITQLQRSLPVRLVIIDTMSRALNGGEGPVDMGALLANADRIRRDTGEAILFVAHCGRCRARYSWLESGRLSTYFPNSESRGAGTFQLIQVSEKPWISQKGSHRAARRVGKLATGLRTIAYMA
jgi:hypothetical protein